MKRISLVFTAFALVAAICLTQGAVAADKMTLNKVTDGVYMMENSRGSSNSTFVVTDDGVLVFDFDIRTADQVLAAIRKITNKKVRYLVSSHSAGDHATGAWHFREDKPVYIASRPQSRDLNMQEAQEFEERKESRAAYKGKDLIKPDIAFDDGMTLYFGGLTFHIKHEGQGHSTGDTTIYIPQKRVFLAGDLLDTEIHPGQGSSSNTYYSVIDGWMRLLDNIMARDLPVDTYVPGHGPVHVGRGVADLKEQKGYFIAIRDEVSKRIQEGKSLAQIRKELKKLPGVYAKYKRGSRLRNFINRTYYQLQGKRW
ncbi:MAG: MBL fold metallo-hydrolase [Alphaproteobacteria bacterium]|nr:MBL fold metallo-hydrolase [Alphaproteobacteria bacterium]